MNTKQKIKMIVTGERPLIDVWYYIQGNYRYYFYYGGQLSKRFAILAWLRKRVLRKHIKEQIDFRIKVMDPQCYNEGSCKICGCETTKLQMADKSCDGNCYPHMMPAFKWQHVRNIIYDYYKVRNNV